VKSFKLEKWLTRTKKYRTPDGTVYIRVLENSDGQPIRIFVEAGKNGEVSYAASSALAAIVGTGLRSGIAVRELWWDLVGVTQNGVNNLIHDASSVPDALGRFLRTHYDPNWDEPNTGPDPVQRTQPGPGS